jgi:hypothetical protein
VKRATEKSWNGGFNRRRMRQLDDPLTKERLSKLILDLEEQLP